MSLLSPTLSFTLKSLLETIPPEEGLHPFQSRVTSFFENDKVTGIAYDSRKVEKGNIFVCIAGEHVDGHDFIAQAVKAKASAVVTPLRNSSAMKNVATCALYSGAEKRFSCGKV